MLESFQVEMEESNKEVEVITSSLNEADSVQADEATGEQGDAEEEDAVSAEHSVQPPEESGTSNTATEEAKELPVAADAESSSSSSETSASGSKATPMQTAPDSLAGATVSGSDTPAEEARQQGNTGWRLCCLAFSAACTHTMCNVWP